MGRSPGKGATGPGRVRQLPVLLALARANMATILIYRADYAVGLVGVLLQIFLLRIVWTALYATSNSSAQLEHTSLHTMIAYATLASLQYWMFNPPSFSVIPQRVIEGKIAIDMCRPVHFLSQVTAGQVGTTFAMVPVVVVGLPFAVLIGGAQPPTSLAVAGAYLVSLLLAYIITVLIQSIVGMVSFWTLEITGFFTIYRTISQFMAGALIPLWFMPDWLRSIAVALPFQAATYTPVAIYLGRYRQAESAILVQSAWIVGLIVVMWLVWVRARRRVVVQGG